MWLKNASITREDFIKNYWRQRPIHLCHDSPLTPIQNSLSGVHLLKLCGDDLVESRLIRKRHTDFALELGPFDLSALPKNSILMIQGLESHLSAIGDLITTQFNFIPRWRIDDVMASYANKDASCGPHFDHYDVFLVQVQGCKEWHLDHGGHKDSDLSPSSEIRLLNNFKATHTFSQKRGDILYIPPGVGHWGIASNDCLTLSVGLRNPTLQEMISHFADLIGEDLGQGETLDNSLSTTTDGIGKETILSLTQQLGDAFLNADLTRRWFGIYMTELREPELITMPESEIHADDIQLGAHSDQVYHCHLATRLAYQSTDDNVLLFANGAEFLASKSTVEWFSDLEKTRTISLNMLTVTDENRRLIAWLVNSGAICDQEGS